MNQLIWEPRAEANIRSQPGWLPKRVRPATAVVTRSGAPVVEPRKGVEVPSSRPKPL